MAKVRLFDLAKRVELGELQEHQDSLQRPHSAARHPAQTPRQMQSCVHVHLKDSVSALQFWKGTLITASSDGQAMAFLSGLRGSPVFEWAKHWLAVFIPVYEMKHDSVSG